ATLTPNSPKPLSPAPDSAGSCRVHVSPDRAKIQATPSPFAPPAAAPISAVFPSEEREVLMPNLPPASPPPVSFAPCWTHAPPERTNTHAAPRSPLSLGPPTSAVLPSPDTATL